MSTQNSSLKRALVVTALITAQSAACAMLAQILPANPAGIAAGHAHIYTTDQTASNAFWTALGGVPLQQGGAFPGIKFPGGIVLFAQTNAGARGGAQTGTGGASAAAREGSVGSAVESLGFKVRNLSDTLSKLQAIGVRPLPGATAVAAAVMSPENVKIQLFQDATMATPVASEDLLIRTADVAASAAWYEKWFGARVVKQGSTVTAEIPGWTLRFVETREPVAGVRGRALDHIGFDVLNITGFIKQLGEGGVTVQTFQLGRGGSGNPIGFVTDPWGVSIELNQGIRDLK